MCGRLLGKIGPHLTTLDGNDVVDAFAEGKTISFAVDGETVVLAGGDVLTEPMQKPGFMAQEDKGVTVVLDTNLTEALITEGYAREVVSKLQTMRKEAGYEVTDRIDVRYTCADDLAKAITAGQDMILRGVLALSMERATPGDTFVTKTWDINGKSAVLAIKKHG